MKNKHITYESHFSEICKTFFSFRSKRWMSTSSAATSIFLLVARFVFFLSTSEGQYIVSDPEVRSHENILVWTQTCGN